MAESVSSSSSSGEDANGRKRNGGHNISIVEDTYQQEEKIMWYLNMIILLIYMYELIRVHVYSYST